MTVATAPPGTDLSVLSALLWRERELLETVLYRLVVQQRLLAAGDVRWLAQADQDVYDALEAVREHDVLRAVEVELVARTNQLAPDVALREIAAAAPEPWPALLQDHRDALRELTAQIDTTTAENRRLLVAGERATRDALERAAGADPAASDPAPAYPGHPHAVADTAHVLDWRV
ncbi:flagellar export chaperone FlgN [uncultured Jatrophihabitans sp.]|uniref:flagellar export chaperone FlgN n=1 Tax=uncultured Jatrophihabitans sp. TaxID=1610747 RepID=UPI0035CA7A9B